MGKRKITCNNISCKHHMQELQEYRRLVTLEELRAKIDWRNK